MKRKLLFLLWSPLLLLCLPNTMFGQIKVRAASGLPVHNLNTGLNYSTIQGAIDAPETLDGHTIEVDAGTYFEHPVVSKSVLLVGESRNDTIIDGSGTGPVVRLSADNATVTNFTIRNGGNVFSPMDTCIFGNNVSNVLIENNTVKDASNGIIFYAYKNSSMSRNLVEGCSVMGLHVDTTADCRMIDNTVTDSYQGIVLEKSTGNLIQGNCLMNNNLSMNFYSSSGNVVDGNNLQNNSVGLVLDSCVGLNNFRDNNISSGAYNLMVWGPSLEAFVQSIDTSNIANNRTVYYIVNADNLTLNSTNCPNVGYLALVNCTRAVVKDVDLSYDKDGLLMAHSNDCSLVNITLANMRANVTLNLGGPSVHAVQGGLTLFQSDNNSVIDSRIANSSIGICLCQSSGNLFCHNSFVDVDEPVISNFQSPVLPPSGSYAANEWENNHEGNFWSNYNGTDANSDGIGDSPYVIDENNTDQYPLMGEFHNFTLSTPSEGLQSLCVISNSTISEPVLDIWLSSPFDGIQPEQLFIMFEAAGESGTAGFCRLMIPRSVLNGSSYIVLVDSHPVTTTVLPISNSTFVYLYFKYAQSSHEILVTIPEFSGVILSLSMLAALLSAAVYLNKTREEHSELGTTVWEQDAEPRHER